MVLAGVLDSDASEKAACFVRFCDAFNIPLIVLKTCPAFCPVSIRSTVASSAKEPSCSTHFVKRQCPRSPSTRKAYGGAYCVMNSRHIRADLVLAWPTAEIAVMGPDGAVNIIFRRELTKAEDPVTRKAELVEDYRERFANPYVAASYGFIDDD